MRMEMLGAKVVSVESGSNTLKDATNEAIRTWAKTAAERQTRRNVRLDQAGDHIDRWTLGGEHQMHACIRLIEASCNGNSTTSTVLQKTIETIELMEKISDILSHHLESQLRLSAQSIIA